MKHNNIKMTNNTKTNNMMNKTTRAKTNK